MGCGALVAAASRPGTVEPMDAVTSEEGHYRFADDPMVHLAETVLAVGCAVMVAWLVPVLTAPAIAAGLCVVLGWGLPALRRLEAELADTDFDDPDQMWGVAGWPPPHSSARDAGRSLVEQTERWLASQPPPPPDRP